MDYSKQKFERLFKDNYPHMYRMAFSLVENADDAKDAVHQVFAQIWRGKPQISEDSFRGYLLAATRNQCLHMLRSRQLQRKMEEELAALVEEGKVELATNMDAAEVKEFAKNLEPRIDEVLGYSKDVTIMFQTIELCEKEDKGYCTAAIADAKANVDTCATPAQMNPMLDALRIARKKNAAERHTEKYVGVSTPEEYMDYYIYNVKEKRFLGAAEAWGTHLALEYISNAMTLIPTDSEGNNVPKGFRVQTHRPNGAEGTADFMGYNGFIDCPVNDTWDFIPVEGKENVFMFDFPGGAIPFFRR